MPIVMPWACCGRWARHACARSLKIGVGEKNTRAYTQYTQYTHYLFWVSPRQKCVDQPNKGVYSRVLVNKGLEYTPKFLKTEKKSVYCVCIIPRPNTRTTHATHSNPERNQTQIESFSLGRNAIVDRSGSWKSNFFTGAMPSPSIATVSNVT